MSEHWSSKELAARWSAAEQYVCSYFRSGGEQKHLAILDAGQEAVPVVAPATPGAPGSSAEEAAAAGAALEPAAQPGGSVKQVIDELFPQSRGLPPQVREGVLDYVVSALPGLAQEKAISSVFAIAMKECGAPAPARGLPRPLPLRQQGGVRAADPPAPAGGTAARVARWRLRMKTRPDSLEAKEVTEEQLRRELHAKLGEHMRRSWRVLCRQYEEAADQRKRLSGGRVVSRDALDRARVALEDGALARFSRIESPPAEEKAVTPTKPAARRRLPANERNEPQSSVKKPRTASPKRVRGHSAGKQAASQGECGSDGIPKRGGEEAPEAPERASSGVGPKLAEGGQEEKAPQADSEVQQIIDTFTFLSDDGMRLSDDEQEDEEDSADKVQGAGKKQSIPGRKTLRDDVPAPQGQGQHGDNCHDSCENGESDGDDDDDDDDEAAQPEQPPELDAEEELQEDEPEDFGATQDGGLLKRRRLQTMEDTQGDVEQAVADPEYPEEAWPRTWHGRAAPRQGDEGFNRYAEECMRRVLQWWEERRKFRGQMPYQLTVQAALHPSSPCRHVLVDQRVGSGKTNVLVRFLDQHFADARKKLPLFPKEAVVENFYDNLLWLPNRYRNYFALMQPRLAARAAGLAVGEGTSPEEVQRMLEEVEGEEWRVCADDAEEVRRRLRVELEMTDIQTDKGHVRAINRGRLTRTFKHWFQSRFPEKMHLLPGAPLRALRLTTAGGVYLAKDEQGQPRNPMAKHGYDARSGNPFDNAVVAIDEAHNLLRDVGYAKQCRRLRWHLLTASNTTLAAFTGTPVYDDGKTPLPRLELELADRRDQLLRIVMGRSPELLPALAGIAHAAGMPVVCVDSLLRRRLEAATRDARCSEGFVCSYHGRLPGATARVLNGDPITLCKQARAAPVELSAVQAMRYVKKHRERKSRDVLQNYINLDVSFGHILQERFLRRSLAAPELYSPKLLRIADQIVRRDEKAVVLLKAHTGFAYFGRLLSDLRDKAGESFGIAGKADIAAFNCRETNLRGERFRVLVGEACECGEGTSFRDVRCLYLGDVPQNATEFEQRVARVDRGDGHRGLPEAERTVRVEMLCGSFPEQLRSPLAAWVWRELVGTAANGQPPHVCDALMRKTGNVVGKLCSQGLDPDDVDSLAELRGHLCEQEDSDADSDCNDTSEEVRRILAKVRMSRVGARLRGLSDEAVSQLAGKLCTSTIDEQLTDELAERWQCVQRAHGKLKREAMDRSIVQDRLADQ